MEESVQGQGTPISEREALIARIKARQQQVMSSGLSKKVLGTDKKLRSAIERTELKNKAAEKFGSYLDSLTLSKPSGLVADDNETTRQFRTANLKSEMSMQMRSQIWDVKLDFGEYRCDFGQDGKTLALAGSKGHVALLDWKQKRLMKEWRLTERTRDIKVVAQNRMVAVAQKDFVSVYDEQGLEVHRLRNMPEPQWLEYLPYHFLLCSISSFGLLSYQDLTTGQIVAEHKTKVREVIFP
jgi:U3 small nucleolar RNA-associated protein 7